MTERNPFAAESRQQVVKSTANCSHSKQLWTFPKKRRFQVVKPECPHAFYQQNVSALSNIKAKFTSSQRNLFADGAQSPSPADYSIGREKSSKGNSFGIGREECRFRTYVEGELVNNPGPNQYDKYASQNDERSKRGFTMRPKTATERNYFIENKELEKVPGPAEYDCQISKGGECRMAKFKSTALGGAGLMKKAKRFESSLTKTPGPAAYEPKKNPRTVSMGFRMGSTSRTSFIDEAVHRKSPGPGDYLLPCEFGHYKKLAISSRLATIS